MTNIYSSIKLIAHRGNFHGANPESENNPDYLLKAISCGYDVEVDLWVINDQIMLGHDKPTFKVSLPFLNEIKDKSWFHAKNYEALTFLLNKNFHCFFHNTDDYTLTSKNIIWSYSGKYISDFYPSVMVMPPSKNFVKENKNNFYAWCGDDFSFI